MRSRGARGAGGCAPRLRCGASGEAGPRGGASGAPGLRGDAAAGPPRGEGMAGSGAGARCSRRGGGASGSCRPVVPERARCLARARRREGPRRAPWRSPRSRLGLLSRTRTAAAIAGLCIFVLAPRGPRGACASDRARRPRALRGAGAACAITAAPEPRSNAPAVACSGTQRSPCRRREMSREVSDA